MEGLLIALVGGLVGGSMGAVEAAEARTHERAMAREARLQERHARAYERILTNAFRLDAWAARTHPATGPGPSPPKLAPDEELFALNALTAAHGFRFGSQGRAGTERAAVEAQP